MGQAKLPLPATISTAGVASTKAVEEARILRVRERWLKMDCGESGLRKQKFGILLGREMGVSFMEMEVVMVFQLIDGFNFQGSYFYIPACRPLGMK